MKTRKEFQALYTDYLESDYWKDKKKFWLDLYGRRCCLCNSEKNIEVHHRTYERVFKEEQADCLLLCAACHIKFHDVELFDDRVKDDFDSAGKLVKSFAFTAMRMANRRIKL